MKKFVKLSLVAAVAVAGLTTANAKPLEEAIKGVDVSGTVAYQYNDRSNDDQSDKNNFTQSKYKIAITAKSNVTDDITFVSKTIIGTGNDMASIDSGVSDINATFALTQANFVYTGLANTTFIAGKQAVPSPFAVQADSTGDENTGNGLTAVVNAGPVTVAGTYLQNTNLITGGEAIAGLGVMANVGPVALDAWYLDAAEANDSSNDGHQAYTLGASAKINVVSLYARYSAVKHDQDGADTESLFKLGAKAKIGIVGFGLDYGMTNDINNATGVKATGVALHGDDDAEVGFQGWGLTLNGKDDADLTKINVNVDVTDSINLSANYNIFTIDSVNNSDADEWVLQATHSVAKNFKYYVRFGQVDSDAKTDKGTRGRLNIVYSF
ncbi:porin [Arcobacter sp. KX21116]|uniref:porin n=1 Tax=Arcobacter iocasae TaxID=2906515 RepID=UPI0035D4CEF7